MNGEIPKEHKKNRKRRTESFLFFHPDRGYTPPRKIKNSRIFGFLMRYYDFSQYPAISYYI